MARSRRSVLAPKCSAVVPVVNHHKLLFVEQKIGWHRSPIVGMFAAALRRSNGKEKRMTNADTLADALRSAVHPLSGASSDYDPLLALIGDRRIVLLGEASHGTHEFYAARAAITQRLITEKGFTAVAVEADWPHAYRVNRYVRSMGDDGSADAALAGFGRFPTWMWRNTVVRDWVEWLRTYNREQKTYASAVGFYGLDLYSLHTSIREVLGYLDAVDPQAAQRARSRYSCFEHFGEDPQAYGYAARFDLDRSCEDEVVTQLVELQRRAGEYAHRDGQAAEEEFFYAEQNARLAKDAEVYYRAMFGGRVSAWNVRDTHMADTLDALLRHLDRHGGQTKVVVWAHNSHLGDARATEQGQEGELNLGQLVRERYDDAAVLVGFSTYTGTVTAASDWDAPPERKRVRPGLPGSYEQLFHDLGVDRFLLRLREEKELASLLQPWRLQRAIGVVYRPQTERRSHYFHVRLPDQFDVMLHFDHTRAVEPLDRTSGWNEDDPPETYPSGL
jgi:erythromycin esterase-like protein